MIGGVLSIYKESALSPTNSLGNEELCKRVVGDRAVVYCDCDSDDKKSGVTRKSGKTLSLLCETHKAAGIFEYSTISANQGISVKSAEDIRHLFYPVVSDSLSNLSTSFELRKGFFSRDEVVEVKFGNKKNYELEAYTETSNKRLRRVFLQHRLCNWTQLNDNFKVEQVQSKLNKLCNGLEFLVNAILKKTAGVFEATKQAIKYFNEFLPGIDNFSLNISMEVSSVVRRITKTVLLFQDNLSRSKEFDKSRLMLLNWYIDFLQKINFEIQKKEVEIPGDNQVSIKNFAIGQDYDFPNIERITLIFDDIVKLSGTYMCEQEGAFIAPLLRGIRRDLAVFTVMFGFPDLQQKHHEVINLMHTLFPDVHIYCVKDYIVPCGPKAGISVFERPAFMKAIKSHNTKFIPPYKPPTNAMAPPISTSLSTEESLRMTGTLGGYLYPQIFNREAELSKLTRPTYAITCAHVVLTENQGHPYVSAPSKVLQNTYKNALRLESERYSEGSMERCSLLKEILRIDENLEWQHKNKFGKVIWGERTIVNQKLSDFAMVKVNSRFHCKNYLGSDMIGMPDLALRLQNLCVRKHITDILPGMEVFKIGASSKHTTGTINGCKLVYWSEGKIQSSEFVVSSPHPIFATGGDSGSWILTRLNNEIGLGVVGMLHSHDGELKQFGLFSVMTDILKRLHDVTGLNWCVNHSLN